MVADPIRVQTVFLGAVNLADADARKAFLEQACGGDADLRGRVEALLRAHDAPDSLLDEPLVGAAAETAPHQDVEAIDATLSFLGPPQRPGSLGRIGHYEVLEVLGRGGFGVVFRAFDEALQRVVAVKVLTPHIAATSPARKRFLREARAAAQVRHENIVQVHAVVEEPLPYLVMEYIPGETLQQRMDRTGPLDAAEVVSIGRQIAAGLAAAHEKGLIHRDIKPTNILVNGGSGRRVTITDFGLARAADDASLTKSGILAGTPMFMAPEQAKGDALDARADLFSLGSVLYTMASGRPPFRASGTMAGLRRVCDEEPRPIKEVIPETPEWLCRIIDKLHAKDPAQRYQSATAVESVLADCEKQLAATAEVKDFRKIPPKARRNKYGRYELRDYSRIPSRPIRLWNPSAWASFLAAVIVIGAGLFVIVRGKMEAARAVEAEHRMRLLNEQANAQRAAQAYRAPIDEKAGWVRLFNGKDLWGWVHRVKRDNEKDKVGGWEIRDDGVLRLLGGGVLYSTEDFDDFHLALEVRTVSECQSGVYFRCNRESSDGYTAAGYFASIDAVTKDAPADAGRTRTGSLTDPLGRFVDGAHPQAPVGRWFVMEIIANGGQSTVSIDGVTTARTTFTERPARRGPIALLLPGAGKSIEFRNIWIKRLTKDETAATPVNAEVVQALRDKAAALEKSAQALDVALKSGSAAPTEFLEARVKFLEANADVAEAEKNPGERERWLKEALNSREEQRLLMGKMRDNGMVPPSAILDLDGKIADLKVKLASASTGAPASSSKATSGAVNALRENVDAKKKKLAIIAKNFAAKAASNRELIEAEVERVEAEISLAEAEHVRGERLRLLEELVKHRQAERNLIEKQIAAKAAPTSALNDIDVKIADTKARLAKAKADAR